MMRAVGTAVLIAAAVGCGGRAPNASVQAAAPAASGLRTTAALKGSASAAIGSNPGPEAAPASAPDATPQQLQAAAVSVLQAVNAKTYDVEPLGRSLGHGVDAAFAFVRDRIAYEAYPGVLRGADGALAAHAANAFDRSLLLARLLAVQHVPTRFATCELSSGDAETLFARMFAQREPAAKPVARTSVAGVRAAAFWARVSTRADHDYQAIKAAAAVVPPPSDTPVHEKAIADIQRHAWVQAQVNDQWIDLDTAFADGKPGQTHCQSDRTSEAIADDAMQRVTIRVTVETLEDGTLKTNPVLEVTKPAVDLVDKDVFLVHTPGNAGGGGGMGLGFVTPAGGGSGWTPVLSIDGDAQTGDAVTFEDVTMHSGGFDALAGGGSSTSSFVAEWLEFEITLPDGSKDVVRRTLVDRAGAAWRASANHEPKKLRPIVKTGSGPAAAQAVYNIWVSAGPHNLARYTRRLLALTYAPDHGQDGSIEGTLRPMAARDFAALVWSDHLIVPRLNDSPQARLYVASPRITIMSLTPDPSNPNNLIEAYDLRRDALRGVPRDSSADALVLDRKLRFASFEGALEHEAAVRDFAASGIDGAETVSTSALLTSAGAAVVTPADLPRVPALTSDPEKRARMSEALQRGDVLVIPKDVFGAGPLGWWDIAPGGDTRAVLGADLNASVSKPPMRAGMNSSGSAKSMGSGSPADNRIGSNTPREVTPDDYNKAIKDALAEDEKPKQKGGAGDEYITSVKEIAMKVLKWAGLAGVILEWKFGDAADQFGAVGMAAGA